MAAARNAVGRAFEFLLSFGAYEGEPELKRGSRRVVVGALWISLPLIALSATVNLSDGETLIALVVVVQVIMHSGALFSLRLWPQRIILILSVAFSYDVLGEVAVSYLYGGLVLSGGTTIWSLIAVLAALLLFGLRSAVVWFVAFAASILLTATMPLWVEPTYALDGVEGDLALSLIGATTITFLVMVYFVRQRDRFQKRSDDLLHNILPNTIAARLKDDDTLIADDIADVSVLFADIVEFTPLSAKLSASELIGLLNSVFTTLDEFVEELGLEKIKTIGDEYMVAGGVPNPTEDHAQAIAMLALRIQETLATTTFEGHTIEMRVGIDSGPVVAGVIGQKKFAYDLWGGTVNTASRMESTGIAGRIQITAATHAHIKDSFVCEPREGVDVKGIGTMDTYFLVGRSPDHDAGVGIG